MAFGKDLRKWLMRRMTPYVVLGIALAATALSALYVYQSGTSRDWARFQALVTQMEEELLSRIAVHETILAATKGFIRADTPPLTRREFEQFVAELDLARNYPGIQGLGYTVHLRADRVATLERFARSQGYTDFRAWPPTGEPYVNSILYLEPLDKRNAAAIGFDMSSNPVRREAMHRAALTGKAALSGPVTLVQEIEGRKQRGFLLYLPIYAGEPTTETDRLRLLTGYSYIPVRADDFLQAVEGRREIYNIGLRIYDGNVASPESMLHSDPQLGSEPHPKPRFRDHHRIEIGGRTWTIEYRSRRAFDSEEPRNLSALVVAVGMFVSLMLYVLALLLQRAWLRAAEQTEDLRYSQAALATRERQLDTLLSNTPDIIARIDRNFRHAYVNPAVESVTGIKAERFLGKTNAELGMPPALVAQWQSAQTRVFETGEAVDSEFTFHGPDGEHVFLARMVPERNAAGQVESVLAVARDITELKQAEARLREAAGRSALLADVAQVFVEARLDESAIADGVVRVLTARLGDVAAILRYNPQNDEVGVLAQHHRVPDLERMLIESRIGTPFPRASTKIIAAVIDSGAPILVGEADLAANAPLIPTEYYELIRRLALKSLTVAPLKAEGRSLGVLALGSRAALSRVDFETAIEIANRTALALENARLYQEAHRAVQLRDEFLSIASHELKTPLTPLQLQMESLDRLAKRNEPIPAERLASIARITVRQVQRLTALVANLLDISRISEGKLALEPEACDLGAIVDETVERFAAESERVGSSIKVSKQGSLRGIWDRLRIEQVVTNLVSNALKYGAGKPVEVFVAEQGVSVELRVVDHGIGLDPEFIPRMFTRFARGVSGRSFGGLGLGLFIVHEIVTSHAGSVEARSGDGYTEFRVLLPAAPASNL